MGMRGSTFLANFSLPMALAVMSVSIQPGRMALARTPWRANSTASARIIEISAALGGGVVLAAGRAFDGRERGRADQRPAATALDHVARRGAEGEEGAVEIDLEHAPPLLALHLGERGGAGPPAHPGIGKAAVDPAEHLHGLGEGRLNRLSRRRRRTRAPAPCARCRPAPTWAAAFLVALVPQMATSAPASASARAMPRPMPLLPPVTRATLPVRSKGLYMGSLRGIVVRRQSRWAMSACRGVGATRTSPGATQERCGHAGSQRSRKGQRSASRCLWATRVAGAPA